MVRIASPGDLIGELQAYQHRRVLCSREVVHGGRGHAMSCAIEGLARTGEGRGERHRSNQQQERH